MNSYSVRSQMLLQKYLKRTHNLYAEPKNEEILGSFVVPCIESDPKRTAPFQDKRKEFQSKIQLHRELILDLCLDVEKIKTENKIMNFKEKSSQKKTVLLL